MEGIKTDIKALFLEKDDCDAGTVQRLRDGLSQGPTQYKVLRDAIDAMKTKAEAATGPAAKKWQLKLGIASFFMGRVRDAANYLKHAESALSQFYLGRALVSLHEYDEALKAFDRAEKAGYTASQVNLQRAGILRHQGNFKAARDTLAKLESLSSHSGEYHYQVGSVALADGDQAAAIKSFERAVELDANNTGALFHLGYFNDVVGNDEEAIGFYERCVSQLPAHVGAMTNLGILYEDNNQYDKAVTCYQKLLAADPTNDRARLFLKDALASKTMYYDEEAEKTFDRFSQVLEIPVTDFELSVRSRNCLKKMNIKTLGDLTRINEPTLLASKNFGETSLLEIKEMMTAKGLRLGQALEEGARYDPRFRPAQPLSEQEQAVMSKPITDLNLSVRARKCMNRLGIVSLSELCNRSADELLEVKNFGMTSLNEVREKLAQYGLKLRGD